MVNNVVYNLLVMCMLNLDTLMALLLFTLNSFCVHKRFVYIYVLIVLLFSAFEVRPVYVTSTCCQWHQRRWRCIEIHAYWCWPQTTMERKRYQKVRKRKSTFLIIWTTSNVDLFLNNLVHWFIQSIGQDSLYIWSERPGSCFIWKVQQRAFHGRPSLTSESCYCNIVNHRLISVK